MGNTLIYKYTIQFFHLIYYFNAIPLGLFSTEIIAITPLVIRLYSHIFLNACNYFTILFINSKFSFNKIRSFSYNKNILCKEVLNERKTLFCRK